MYAEDFCLNKKSQLIFKIFQLILLIKKDKFVLIFCNYVMLVACIPIPLIAQHAKFGTFLQSPALISHWL
jgi:hypothetical protein